MIERGEGGYEIEMFARDHRMSTARRLLQHLGDQLEQTDGAAPDVVGGSAR